MNVWMNLVLAETQETVGTILVFIICILFMDIYISGFMHSACLQ